jgi:uncharacterized membrane protein YfcA
MNYLWLCLSAAAAGAVNAIAGGGTLLTFPVLERVLTADLAALMTAELALIQAAKFANATSTVALFPGSFASVWGYRKQLPACKRWIVWLTAPSLLGGALGALLVGDSFRFIVPWLILLAAILFTLQPTIARMLKHQASVLHQPSTRMMIGIVCVQFLIGIYGGYFGAGIGILMLSSLSFLGLEDIHHLNALKSTLAFAMNTVAAILFIARGMVQWEYALAMALAAIVGGYVGARLSLRLRPIYVRWIVIGIGFGLAAYYFAKPWLMA